MRNFKCNVCAGNEWKSVYKKKALHPLWWLPDNSMDIDLNYVICRKCGYITLFPRLNADEYEKYYRLVPTPARDTFLKRKPMYESRKSFILDKMAKHELDVVIEVGPAYGDFLLLLSEFNKRIGIEPSQDYCGFVEASKLPLEYYCCSLENISQYNPGLLFSSNLVVASNVLEHAFEPRIFIRHLFDLTKTGGYVYIEVPSVEAMSEVKAPSYQTLHFGHISQFTVDVLNQLCVSESLEPICAEVFSTNDYPVLRALYRRANRAKSIEKLFQRHVEFYDMQAATAKTVLLAHFGSGKNSQMILWGCGQDLLDVLNLCDSSQVALLLKRVKLVDMNINKQHRMLAGFMICAPAELKSLKVDIILISSRSKLIQADIMKEASQLFPDAELVVLYP